MQKRVFIIHGWDGQPDEGGFPWQNLDEAKRRINSWQDTSTKRGL